MENRLKQLESQTRGQADRAVIGTAKPSPITSNEILALDHVSHDVSSQNLGDSFSSESLSRDPPRPGGVSAIARPGLLNPQKSTVTDQPTILCSSNSGFIRSVDSSWTVSLGGDSNTDCLPSIPKVQWKRAESSMVLPRRHVADDLLHSFFTFAHDFLPIFHKPAFQKQYESLWVSNAPARPNEPQGKFEDGIFLSTLNVCFALGCLFSELVADEDRETAGDEYYQRSRALTNFDICDYSSLSTVRLQLVTGLYLQSTSHASRCWNVVGMAVRLAQDLGLHKDTSAHAQSDSVEVEMKRRVWYSCVVMDR